MKLFLSTSFSGQLDSIKQEVLPEHRTFIEQLLTGLRTSLGVEVYAAIEQENWRLSQAAPEIGVQADLTAIDASDIVLAIVSDKISAGVQFELGYAMARDKRLFIAHKTTEKLAYFNQGAVSAGLLTAMPYDDVAMLLQELSLAINLASSPGL